MTRKKTALIVGTDSQIGGRLSKLLVQAGFRIVVTTRREHLKSSNELFLDLSDSDTFRTLTDRFDVAFLCAAITSIEDCERDPELSQRVNVDNLVLLSKKLVRSGSFVLFLSTADVYSKACRQRRPEAPVRPRNLYGRQKAQAEKLLLGLSSTRVAVVRLSKVYSEQSRFIRNWEKEFQRSGKITAFNNVLHSYIDLDSVAQALVRLGDDERSGIHHLSGVNACTPYEFALKFFNSCTQKKRSIVSAPSPLESLGSRRVRQSDVNQPTLKSVIPAPRLSERWSAYSLEGIEGIFFQLFRAVSTGCFVDVGANHPVRQSSTYGLYLAGWSGVAIDGSDKYSPAWRRLRPRDIFHHGVVSDRRRPVDFIEYSDDTMSTSHKKTSLRYSSRNRVYERRSTEAVPLTELLAEQRINQEIHLLSVDVEGAELEVLKGLNLQSQRPGVISVETKGLSLTQLNANQIWKFLGGHGYVLLCKTMLDAVFIAPEKTYLSWIPGELTRPKS